MGLTRYAVWCGNVASVTSMAALMWAAKREGRSIWQPANATSHWLHGDRAGAIRRADGKHTLLGLSTHHASAMFWGIPFGAWLASHPRRRAVSLFGDALVAAGFAAAFDYLLIPKRLRPGWELVVSNRSVALGFGAMAVGLAIGGLVAQNADMTAE